MLLVFTFAFNTETEEAVVGGNIDSQVALNILQKIVIAQAVIQIKEKEDAGKNQDSDTGN